MKAFEYLVLEALICLLNIQLSRSENEIEIKYIKSTKLLLRDYTTKEREKEK